MSVLACVASVCMPVCSGADALALTNRVLQRYSRVVKGLRSEEALREQRERLGRRTAEAVREAVGGQAGRSASRGKMRDCVCVDEMWVDKGGCVSGSLAGLTAMEYWVVRDEERCRRAVQAMDTAANRLEALRAAHRHEKVRRSAGGWKLLDRSVAGADARCRGGRGPGFVVRQALWRWLTKGLADLPAIPSQAAEEGTDYHLEPQVSMPPGALQRDEGGRP